MFLLSFIIAMVVALLIYWIRSLLTSVRVNSFFDENSKNVVRRAVRIHKIHGEALSAQSEIVVHEMHPELFYYQEGLNEEFEQPENYQASARTIKRRKRNIRKHKNL